MTGNELRRWRLRHGWTIEEAAQWADVHTRTWIRWEMGTTPIKKLLMLAVAAY